ncbi:expansin EXLX1 family cellulose-binding protein [Micromonospora krabiensis]|uniref:Peptidoglycan-binding domain-containing protein, expansin n=1 Tax=Micromonospora krabiensis TaxID=307121 RepID=A0A1C3N4U4_9ACTN|nr:expansin EXLX1 family cellulose-binding protein [Micromonospora krabiensis]SBV27612.1 Peptidoglycan-binding domain-containing protein, expansin [Micromonospora krabiensis]
MTDGGVPQSIDTEPWGAGRRRAPRSRVARWLVATTGTALAAIVGLAVALHAGAAPACATVGPPAVALPAVARPAAGLGPPLAAPMPAAVSMLAAAPGPRAAPPTGGAVRKGKATFYDSKGAGGNCSDPSAPANRLYVALGPDEYAAGAACGGHLDVTGPKGSVRVLIMDQCPECPTGHLDLSREAFARIADPVQGVVPVSYRAVVDPPLAGPLTFRIKEGASQWWFAVRVADHGNPLRSVEVRAGTSGWRAAARQDYNYWLIESGAGPGPFQIRVTDVYGHRVTASGIRMTPGRIQRGDVRMYGGAGATRTTRSPSARTPTARPTPTPAVATTTASPTALAAPAAAVVPAASGGAAPAPGCGG